MHIHKSRFLLRGEVWYDGEPDKTPVDWILYRQRHEPVPGTKWKLFHTILVDLVRSPEALLQGMSSSTAYKIRRARDKDRILCECPQSVSKPLLENFATTYSRFAEIKGLAPLDRPFLDQLAADGVLEISVAREPDGAPLAYHVYYRGPSRCFLLHTVSSYHGVCESSVRNAIGRANRYLFWSDMVRNSEKGLKHFDFGGWYPGDTDLELLDINQFKEGFGGQIVREYNCEQIVSLKGRVVLAVAALLRRATSRPAKVHPGKKLFESGTARPVRGDQAAESPSGLQNPAPQEQELAN